MAFASVVVGDVGVVATGTLPDTLGFKGYVAVDGYFDSPASALPPSIIRERKRSVYLEKEFYRKHSKKRN
jgi:hypothetical protein